MPTKVLAWPQGSLEGQDVTLFNTALGGKLGALYLADDGGIYMYGQNKAAATLAAGDLVKFVTDTGKFTATVAGDADLGVRQLSACSGAPTADQYGYWPWICPHVDVAFTAVAVAAGKAWAISATAKKAKVWATDGQRGSLNAANATAGGVVKCSLRC